MRLQSAGILTGACLVGAAFAAAGSPWWVALLYVVAGIALAVARLRLGRPAAAGRRAIGYIHTTADRPRERSSEVRRFCGERGLDLTVLVHDGGETRGALPRALARLEAGEADVLVVSRLQDLSSDVASLAPLLKWFAGGRPSLIAVDLALDTSTEAGRLAVAAIADVGAWDARPTSPPSLTLVPPLSPAPPAALSAAGPAAAPPGPAQPRVADVPDLQARIRRMRAQGLTLQAIADALNAEGVPTLRGGALWRPSSVQRACGYRRPGRGIEVDPGA